MASLESRVKPTLTLFVQGGDRVSSLKPLGQKLIALWAVKTAMMFQQTTRRRLIPEAHFHELFQHQRPPRQSHVWLGVYRGTTHSLGRFFFMPASISGPNEGGTSGPDAYVVTLTIGHLILQVFGYISDSRLKVTRPLYEGALAPLWPTKRAKRGKSRDVRVPWLGWDGFDDERLIELESAFIRRSPDHLV